MDIHKPKPWRGWREFLKEYVIVVVGVLTALAGEQLVETIHKNNELAETREALRQEIAENAGIVALDGARDVCGEARGKLLIAWAQGGAKPPQRSNGGSESLQFSAWEMAKSGPLGKMPVKERLTYSHLYDRFTARQANMDRGVDDGLNMAQYTSMERLSVGQAERLIELGNRTRLIRAAKAINAQRVFDAVKALGIRPAPASEVARSALDAACQAAGIPTPAY